MGTGPGAASGLTPGQSTQGRRRGIRSRGRPGPGGPRPSQAGTSSFLPTRCKTTSPGAQDPRSQRRAAPYSQRARGRGAAARLALPSPAAEALDAHADSGERGAAGRTVTGARAPGRSLAGRAPPAAHRAPQPRRNTPAAGAPPPGLAHWPQLSPRAWGRGLHAREGRACAQRGRGLTSPAAAPPTAGACATMAPPPGRSSARESWRPG